MGFVPAHLWCAFGIVLSIVLPVLRRYLPETAIVGVTINSEPAGPGLAEFWAWPNPTLS